MTDFIKLTDVKLGGPVYIRISNIVAVLSYKGQTYVKCASESDANQVQETVKDVLHLISANVINVT